MTRFAFAVLFVASLAMPCFSADSGDVDHPFYVSSDEIYSDYVQFADGHAQGVYVFYFTEQIGDFNRLVVFCDGNTTQGRAYEDAKNNRIVWSRPLSEFSSFARFQQELGKSTVYGTWVTRADGAVTTVALQIYKKGAKSFNRQEPGPSIGKEYTGRK